MGVRAENKKIYRDKILAAAKEVFSVQGFEDTTIEQIAENAGIGLGTAYNYFKSKEELFVLAMADDMADSKDQSLEKINFVSGKAADIIYDAIFKQIKRLGWINKKIWRVAFPIILGSMKSDKLQIQEVFRADFKMMEKTKILIHQMKEFGLISIDFDEDTANDLIFSLLLYHTSLYIYSDEISFEDALDRIKRGIEFVFANDGIYHS